jgi:CheY-like chemotaxis protein
VDRTIIVVDDDPWNVDAIADVLREAGYHVVVANDGDAGIALARHAPRPCLVVLDLMLPKVHGWDVVRELRGNRDTADIPIITCTASLAEAPDGVTAHVRKPFGVDELLDTIARAFHDTLSDKIVRD